MADASIVNYIRENLEKFPEQQLRGYLVKEGVSEDEIEAAFREAKGASPFEMNSAPVAVQKSSGNMMYLAAIFLSTTLLIFFTVFFVRAKRSGGGHGAPASQESDTPEGQNSAAKNYLSGIGVERDPARAFELFKRAAERGYPEAQYYVGIMYEKGNGVLKNQDEGDKWLGLAAENGSLEAKKALEELLAESRQNTLVLMKKSAEQGNTRAQFYLAGMYLDGDRVEQDDEQGFRWMKKSAEQGDAEAQYKLGVLYASGRGVPVSAAEGIAWLKKSAAQGNPGAKGVLARLGISGR